MKNMQGKSRKRAMWLGTAAAFAITLAFATGAQAQYKVAQRYKMPDGGWDYATSDHAKGLIYWVRTTHTDVIDSKTGMHRVLASTGNGHMAVVVEGTSLVVVPMRVPARTSRIIDTANDTVVMELPSGEAPDGAIYDPSTKHVFVANHNSGDVTEIDPIAKKVVATIAIGGGKLEFPAADGKGHVFVNVQDTGEVAVIDVKTSKMTARYKMAGCENASGLAYASKAGLLIASCGNGTARVLDAETGKELASIPIGKGPDSVIYEATQDVAFIPCGTSGELEVIAVGDAKNIRKLQTLAIPPLARTGAVDAQGRLYMMAAIPDPDKPKGGGGRPTPRDGSYEMVIVSK